MEQDFTSMEQDLASMKQDLAWALDDNIKGVMKALQEHKSVLCYEVLSRIQRGELFIEFPRP